MNLATAVRIVLQLLTVPLAFVASSGIGLQYAATAEGRGTAANAMLFGIALVLGLISLSWYLKPMRELRFWSVLAVALAVAAALSWSLHQRDRDSHICNLDYFGGDLRIIGDAEDMIYQDNVDKQPDELINSHRDTDPCAPFNPQILDEIWPNIQDVRNRLARAYILDSSLLCLALLCGLQALLGQPWPFRWQIRHLPARDASSVFLSYSTTDQSVVNEFKEALRRQGLDPWDFADQNKPGDRIWDKLNEGLLSPYSLVFWSATYKAKTVCREEVNAIGWRVAHDPTEHFTVFIPIDATPLPPLAAGRVFGSSAEEVADHLRTLSRLENHSQPPQDSASSVDETS